MIVYDRLWKQMEKKKISQYRLGKAGLSQSTLTRLKNNEVVTTETLDKICSLLHCRLEDIAEFIDESE
ncbi:MAG: helix-turn-helix transcriptional regulator [Lachnospiraceae bacterium]|nr:helix-turn-helix transcriptional regulator [Lachnospiraceae bacterium]